MYIEQIIKSFLVFLLQRTQILTTPQHVIKAYINFMTYWFKFNNIIELKEPFKKNYLINNRSRLR